MNNLLPRIIPCLLIKDRGLVKTVRFKNPSYVGDPLNAVRIFNEKEVDELVVLDITATKERRSPRFDIVSDIAGECFMPLGYGGGIRSIEDAKELFNLGVEKIIINSYAVENPGFIRELSEVFGSQSIVVSVDVKKSITGRYAMYTHGGTAKTSLEPLAHALSMQELGAGEIFINSIDRDGTMQSYDLKLVRSLTSRLTIPVIACGGAGCEADLISVLREGGASAAAAGSMCVYHGRHRAVLITYPDIKKIAGSLKCS